MHNWQNKTRKCLLFQQSKLNTPYEKHRFKYYSLLVACNNATNQKNPVIQSEDNPNWWILQSQWLRAFQIQCFPSWGDGGRGKFPHQPKIHSSALPNFYPPSLTKSQFSPLINCSRDSLIPIKSFYLLRTNYGFWNNFFNLVLRAFSWIWLEAIDIHNRHDKTTALKIYDQNKSLCNIPDQLFLLQSWELQPIVNLHLAHQISNTHQILIVWNY